MTKLQPEILDRMPPNDPAAEQAVLGSVILNPAVLDEIANGLPAEAFYAHAHQLLWNAMLRLHQARRAIDGLTLSAELRRAGDIEAFGGMAYLAEVAQSVPVAAHAAHYAAIVRRKAEYRALISAASEAIRDAYAASDDPADIVNRTEASLAAVRTGEFDGDPVHAAKVAVEVCDRLESIFSKSRPSGVMTGIQSFDVQFGGLFAGELVILAARPSQGKSALALQIAAHVAGTGKSTYLASLEMPRVDLGIRMVCSMSGVNSRVIRTGQITDADMQALAGGTSRLANTNLFFHYRPGMSPYDVRRAARRIKSKAGLSLVIVDYLQIMTPNGKHPSREREVASMISAMKELAGELEVPVLCLCQTNREEEQDDEPEIRHLRESGSIEQDADMVMFVRRGVRWQKPGRDPKAEPGDEPADWKAMLWLKKNRNGERGAIRLRWVPEQTRFEQPDDSFAEFDSFRGQSEF
jgi:replicative DNA helicase